MTKEEFGGVVRTLAAAAFGWFGLSSYFDAATVQALVGAVGVIAVALWSVWQKKKTA